MDPLLGMSDWYRQDVTSVLRNLKTDLTGLTTTEADRRLSQHGKNELIEQASRSSKRMLWEQFTSTPVLLLIAAAAVSAYLQDYKDTIAILAIVLFNALLGFNQEYRASKAFAALKNSQYLMYKCVEMIDGRIFSVTIWYQVTLSCWRLEAQCQLTVGS